MFGTDEAVVGGAVLQEVAVAVVLEVVPFYGHLGGLDGEVVFSLQVVLVLALMEKEKSDHDQWSQS